jgi:hypothetical protein
VMDEQVLGLVIGCDEAKALDDAEPLDGSCSHCVPPAFDSACERGDC